jgi:hypothetical protein
MARILLSKGGEALVKGPMLFASYVYLTTKRASRNSQLKVAESFFALLVEPLFCDGNIGLSNSQHDLG